MAQCTEEGKKNIGKQISVLTVSQCIVEEVNLTRVGDRPRSICQGRDGAQQAQIYPLAFCRAARLGLMEQKQTDAPGCFTPGTVNNVADKDATEIVARFGDLHGPEEWDHVWDDVTGKMLKCGLLRQARREEFEYVKQVKGYSEGLHKSAYLGVLERNRGTTDRRAMDRQ